MVEQSPLARFRAHALATGLRLTGPREAIVEAFFSAGRHLSLNEIHTLALERRAGVGFATVYRTMRLLVESGLATEHKFGEDYTVYEAASEGEHHDHLICVDCGKIVEFENHELEELQERIARELGYSVVSHRHEIYVRCIEQCENKQMSREAR